MTQTSIEKDATTIDVDNVSVSYGDTPIIRGLSCRAASGALTVLVGPNGSGKSTLLKAMARILPVSQGKILLDGIDVHRAPTLEVARKLALLPQGPIAPEGLTVKELVSQGRFPYQSLMRQWSEDDARAVANALSMTFLSAFADRQVSSLSGGQRQRCWIAMVLAQETPVLLLDEPTTFLDLKVQVELMSLLSTIARSENRTVLVVMHDLNVAAAFADRMIMMRDGKLIADGPVSRVFTAENLETVFALKASILIDPVSERPVCIPRQTETFKAAE